MSKSKVAPSEQLSNGNRPAPAPIAFWGRRSRLPRRPPRPKSPKRSGGSLGPSCPRLSGSVLPPSVKRLTLTPDNQGVPGSG